MRPDVVRTGMSTHTQMVIEWVRQYSVVLFSSTARVYALHATRLWALFAASAKQTSGVLAYNKEPSLLLGEEKVCVGEEITQVNSVKRIVLRTRSINKGGEERESRGRVRRTRRGSGHTVRVFTERPGPHYGEHANHSLRFPVAFPLSLSFLPLLSPVVSHRPCLLSETRRERRK